MTVIKHGKETLGLTSLETDRLQLGKILKDLTSLESWPCSVQ